MFIFCVFTYFVHLMKKNFLKYLFFLLLAIFAMVNWHLEFSHYKNVNENSVQKSFSFSDDFFQSKTTLLQLQNTFTNCKTSTQYKNSYIDRHHSNAEILESETEIEDSNILSRRDVDIFFKTNVWKVLFAFLNDFYSQQSAVFLTNNLSTNKSTDGLYIVYSDFRL